MCGDRVVREGFLGEVVVFGFWRMDKIIGRVFLLLWEVWGKF